MPRYFFNIGSEGPDTQGVELPNHQAVRGEAIRAAGEILRDIDGAFSGREWTMNVMDDGGNVVLELRFSVKEAHLP